MGFCKNPLSVHKKMEALDTAKDFVVQHKIEIAIAAVIAIIVVVAIGGYLFVRKHN
jgi:hypothetical protein